MSLINEHEKRSAALLAVINKLMLVIAVLVTGLIAIPFFIYYDSQPPSSNKKTADTVVPKAETNKDTIAYWIAPDISNITNLKQKEQIIYGKELIAHTSTYFGPNGSVLKVRGSPLNDNKKYKICACERDGDPTDMLCRIKGVSNAINTTETLHSVLFEYLAINSPVTPAPLMASKILDAPQTLLTQVTGVDYQFR